MSSYVYGKSGTMLWNLFKQKGEIEGAEEFLKLTMIIPELFIEIPC